MKKSRLICIILTFLLGMTVFAGCGGSENDDDLPVQPSEVKGMKYITMVFTNKHYEEVESFASEMKVLLGENDAKRERMYAAGYMGPMLLTQSIAQMQAEVNTAFDMAEKFNIPVYFQLDDVNNYTTQFGGGAEVKYWEDPSMCEWIAFPEEGEEYGGQKKYGQLPRFWYNWGNWRVAKAVPNFASPKLRELVVHNLQEGFLKPLNERYSRLKKQGKDYLFAGCAVGWETHIPDYSSDNRLLNVREDNLPHDYSSGAPMLKWELAQYGYGALNSLGYNQKKIDEEANGKGISSGQHIKNILFQVIHDYTELLAKTVNQAGIPREKIYSHTVAARSAMDNDCTFYPPIWTAVNDYCTPGYTMSPVTCKFNLKKMKKEIYKTDPAINEFAVAEGYAAGFDTVSKCDSYFVEMFANGARNITCFGYPDVGVPVFEFRRSPDFPYIISTNNWLRGDLNKRIGW